MAIKIPGVDTEKGLDLYDDDEDIYAAVLRSYVENTPPVLESMRSVSAGNLADYAAAAHGIKGTSATIGAEDIRSKALEMETLAKAGDLSGVLAQNDAFLKQVSSLVSNINDWLKQYDSQK